MDRGGIFDFAGAIQRHMLLTCATGFELKYR